VELVGQPIEREVSAGSQRPCRTTRRTFLLATAAVISGLSVLTEPQLAHAQQVATAALDDAEFLRLSKAVTGNADLDATISSRLMAALHRADPSFIDHAASLARLAQDGQLPEALLTAADAAGLSDTMLTLVAAWYTCTVGHGQQAEMVSYADALMYRPVSDGLPVPTYCFNGPLGWPGPPPPAGVSAPAGTPLASPAQVPAATSKGG
jgi:fructose 5-dehydrogenase small subunit